MSWEISIPYKDRDDLVLYAITAARETEMRDDQRAVLEVIVNDAFHNRGVITVGELIDELGDLSEAECRQRLDAAREEAGLPSATEVDHRKDLRRFEREDVPPPPQWSQWQGCPAKGCNARPTRENGSLRAVTVERWWCPQHEDQAQPGDLDEHEPAYIGIGLNGRLIPSEKERARIAAFVRERDEPRELERRQREELRVREHEAIMQAEERYEGEEFVSVMGIKVHPRDVRFSR